MVNGRGCRKIEEPPVYQKFKFENITVIHPPLLKIYYWELLGIDNLNAKLNTDQSHIQHGMQMLERYINSPPIKIIFWIRNTSTQVLELKLKRIKNCICKPIETRVGFNQFRQLYHCPHRRLIHILQERLVMQPNDLVAMSVTTYYFLYGQNKLTYEISTSDQRILTLDMFVNVTCFEPASCLLTRELLPSNIKEQRRFVQPIWIRNYCGDALNFQFLSRDRRLKILNRNLTVPRQSIWPLLVEFRPLDYNNEVELSIGHNNLQTTVAIKGVGMLETPNFEIQVPEDIECADFLNVIFPNKVQFETEINQMVSAMVAVTNFSKTCWEYRWQSYSIPDLFDVHFEPPIFRLKPGHTKLCVIVLKTFKRAVHFTRIPVVLEVHRVLDKSTKIAKALLQEVESIDNPKWQEDSYMEHVFLQLNIKVNMPAVQAKAACDFTPCQSPVYKKERDNLGTSKYSNNTVFEKIYWEELANSNFMRANVDPYISDDLDYDEVLSLPMQLPKAKKPTEINDCTIVHVLGQIVAEALRDISKNWIFIPFEYVREE